ncbi:hypothetical protein ACED23_26240, partial [Vibrio splendidus]|uniref:hypothetical protein n=1 Tax=Vibrio splendidus TaxID=29497 RepID=UPI00352D1D65
GWRDSNSQHADLEFYKTKHKNSMLEQFKNQSTRISVYFCILFTKLLDNHSPLSLKVDNSVYPKVA